MKTNARTRRRLCFVTGSRSEYGLLKPLMELVRADDGFELQLIVTGSHLSPEFGMTGNGIEEDGFRIDRKLEILLSSDSFVGMAKSLGLAALAFADAFSELGPDMVVILGDRYEILAAASVALIEGIPIAHLHGGELTRGAVDDSMRHATTKMSHLHFTSTEQYRERVIQMGEHPDTVFNVGALGLDSIRRLAPVSKTALEKKLRVHLGEKLFLVTFHPVTVGARDSSSDFRELISALELFPDATVVLTKANADAGGRAINSLIDEFVAAQPESRTASESLGQLAYLSVMKLCTVVVGNSSSGIIEAPSMHVPTVNVGDRQEGRIRAESILDCDARRDSIARAIQTAYSPEFLKRAQGCRNPYGDGRAAERIFRVLQETDPRALLAKRFYPVAQPAPKG